MAIDPKKRGKPKSAAPKKAAPPPPPPPPPPAPNADLRPADYPIYQPFLNIAASPNDRVRRNMPQVDKRLLDIMAVASLMNEGNKVRVTSGYRNYHINESNFDTSKHGKHVAVDLDWGNIPGDTRDEKAENLANIARILSIKNFYATTETHGSGAHAHLQIGEIGLNSHNSERLPNGKERTFSHAEQALRENGLTKENFIDAVNEMGPDARRNADNLVGSIGRKFTNFMGITDSFEKMERDRVAKLNSDARTLADAANVTPERLIEINDKILGKKSAADFAAVTDPEKKAFRAFLTAQDIDAGDIDGPRLSDKMPKGTREKLIKAVDAKLSKAAGEFSRMPGGAKKYVETFYKATTPQTAVAVVEPGILEKAASEVRLAFSPSAIPQVTAANATQAPPRPPGNIPASGLPRNYTGLADKPALAQTPNKPPAASTPATQQAAVAPKQAPGSAAQQATAAPAAKTPTEPVRPAAAAVPPVKAAEPKIPVPERIVSAALSPVTAAEPPKVGETTPRAAAEKPAAAAPANAPKAAEPLDAKTISLVAKRGDGLGIDARTFGRAFMKLEGTLGNRKFTGDDTTLAKARDFMETVVGKKFDGNDAGLTKEFGDKVREYQKASKGRLKVDGILGAKTFHHAQKSLLAEAGKRKQLTQGPAHYSDAHTRLT